MAQAAVVRIETHEHFRRAMRPIDLVHLAKQCLGDENLEYEILRLFDATVDTYFVRLCTAENDAELVMCLHSIRGAAAGVGAFTVSDLARAAEADMKAGRALNPEALADIGVAIEEVRAFIARMLSHEPS